MVIKVEEVISPEQAHAWRAAIVNGGDPSTDLLEAVLAHPLVQIAAQPLHIGPLTWRHGRALAGLKPVPTAVIERAATAFRADLGVTVFLSEPCNGSGDLILEHGTGVEQVSGSAGTAIIWSADLRRGFAPSREDECCLAEFLVQSLVADPEQREILYDLGHSASVLETFDASQAAEAENIRGFHHQLLRMWARP